MPSLAVLVPLSALGGVVATVAVCYATHVEAGRQRLTFPPISELGIAAPERIFYRAGFSVVGAMLALHIWLSHQAPQPSDHVLRLLKAGDSLSDSLSDAFCTERGFLH